MSDFSQFLTIRATYASLMPEWMEVYAATGDMRHDPYFMDWQFTPIERNVWSDIRQLGLPLFPQLPALNYFLDFGNPFLKIGVECDGKAWHDAALDRARDKRLAADGWMIFRIEGHECVRTIDTFEFGDAEEDEVLGSEMLGYYGTTSEGILRAIQQVYFSDAEISDRERFCIDATLFNHRSTPETFPQRRPRVEASRSYLVGECMPEYLELLRRRAERPAERKTTPPRRGFHEVD